MFPKTPRFFIALCDVLGESLPFSEADDDHAASLRAWLSLPTQRSHRVHKLLKARGHSIKTAPAESILKALKTARGKTAAQTKPPRRRSTSRGPGGSKGPEIVGRAQGRALRTHEKSKQFDPRTGGMANPDDLQDSVLYVPQTLYARALAEGDEEGFLALLEAKRAKARKKREKGKKEGKKGAKVDKKAKRAKKKKAKAEKKAGKRKGEKGGKGGKGKFANETTFKSCKGGAMIATKGMRASIPQDRFVIQRRDGNNTFPVRTDCRASIAGGLRAAQFKPSKTHPGTPAAHGRAFRARVNRLGGVKGKVRMTAWAPGKRYKTVAPGKMDKEAVKRYADKHGISIQDAKRHFRDKMERKIEATAKKHGVSKRAAKKKIMGGGRKLLKRDIKPHTDKSEHGKPHGPRSIAPVKDHAALPTAKKMSKRKAARQKAGKEAGVKGSEKFVAKYRQRGEHHGKGRRGREKFAAKVAKMRKMKAR